MHNIAIIGTGVSGLAAAIHILDNARAESYSMTVFESRHIPGGRTRSYVDPETGDTLDNGQHLLMGCYTATDSYLKAIGSAALIERSRNLSIPFALYNEFTGQSRIARLSTGPFPAPLHALWGLLRTDLLTAEEKLAAIKLSRRVEALLEASNVSAMTCDDLFQQLHQPAGLVRKLWQPIVLATLNAQPTDAAALPFLMVLKLSLLEKKSYSTLWYPNLGLSELLIEPAIERLKTQGILLQFRSHVTAIESTGQSFSIVMGSSRHPTRFDSVILAFSPSDMALPIGISVKEPEFSPIVNAYFWVDRRIMSSPIHAFINTTLQWAFDKSTTYAEQRLALTVSAAGDLVASSNEEITRILWRDLQRSFSEAARARLLHSQIIKEKRATPLFTPDTFRDRPAITTKLPGFYLAGDLVQNMLPATIEGAIRNGTEAGRLVVSSIARTAEN